MPFTRDVCRDFETIRQTDAGHFAQRGVRLLRRRRVDAGAHAALLRVATQVRRLFFLLHVAAAVPDELVNGRQNTPRKWIQKKVLRSPGKLNALFELGQGQSLACDPSYRGAFSAPSSLTHP